MDISRGFQPLLSPYGDLLFSLFSHRFIRLYQLEKDGKSPTLERKEVIFRISPFKALTNAHKIMYNKPNNKGAKENYYETRIRLLRLYGL